MMTQVVLFCVTFCIMVSKCWSSELENQEEKNISHLVLIQTSVIFRHGARTTYKFYPTDPHKNQTFYPFGLGGLTNNGKMGEFRLGQFLRKEYDTLLGPIFKNKDVYIRSTHTMRTLMSAQLVLAGLYPPVKEQIWNPNLLWQPIPVFSRLRNEEDLMHPDECPRKLAIYNNLTSYPDIREKYVKPYEKLYRLVQENSGMAIRNPHDLLEFYFIVNTEAELNLTLPEWVQEIYPNKIYDVASLTYSYLNSNVELMRINVGYLTKKIIKDMQSILVCQKDAAKIYLYSGHESTIGFMLYALNVSKPHVPAYGSAILIELFRDSHTNETYVQVRYRDSPTASDAVELIISGCTKLCPLKTFIELQKYYMPLVNAQEACERNV